MGCIPEGDGSVVRAGVLNAAAASPAAALRTTICLQTKGLTPGEIDEVHTLVIQGGGQKMTVAQVGVYTHTDWESDCACAQMRRAPASWEVSWRCGTRSLR
jgi:hypothetical protein